MFASKNLLIIVTLFLCGCAQGFDRAVLRGDLNKDGLVQTNDQDIAAVRAIRPQAAFPVSIGRLSQARRRRLALDS